MGITKKFDRAFQWAGEKMGQDAKTNVSEDFKSLEQEMALRHDGTERLHKSMNAYVKSMSRRGETFDDKEKGLPVSYLGRTMIAHGEDFEPESEYGNCLIAMGRGNERIAGLQETYVSHASSYWLEGLERSLAMMKEYQAARKKLENRRLAYDAAATKLQKAKREDFRLEDELRTSKAKYEEASEDVYRRMQDIKECEADSVQDLTNFLDAELDHYERCAEEMRQVRRDWAGMQQQSAPSPYGGRGGDRDDYSGSSSRLSARPSRSRSNTARSTGDRNDRTERWASRQQEDDIYEESPPPPRMPIRSARTTITPSSGAAPVSPPRPNFHRSNTYGGGGGGGMADNAPRPTIREPPPMPAVTRKPSYQSGVGVGGGASQQDVGSLRAGLRPVSRITTANGNGNGQDVFGDDYDTNTSSGSPEYDRSVSPATSYGSLSRTTSNTGLTMGGGGGGGGPAVKKAPPPPPSRSKKPPPPIPQKREMGY